MPINVLHLAHLTIGYGVERQLLDHLTLVNQKPNEIKHHVCALQISDLLLGELVDLKIPFTVNRLWPWQLAEFKKFVKKYHIQILHVHNQLRFPLRSRILPKLAGVPLIIEHEHGMVWNTSATGIIKLTNHLVAANICNSNAAKIMLKQRCGIDAQVIYNGVIKPPEQKAAELGDLPSKLGIPENSKIVGFVGRLNTPKGVAAFIRMIPLVKQIVPQARFVIIGDGPLKDELAQNAAELGVAEQVFFLGYQKNARQLMQQMEVIVVPSIREPFGNVVIEAAWAKRPVVVSNVDGMAETVIDGQTGFLVDCTEPVKRSTTASRLPQAVVDGRTRELRPPLLPDIQSLADRVVRCLQDPVLARTMGENASRRAEKFFSLERYREELDELYRELVTNG